MDRRGSDRSITLTTTARISATRTETRFACAVMHPNRRLPPVEVIARSGASMQRDGHRRQRDRHRPGPFSQNGHGGGGHKASDEKAGQ